MWFITKKKNIDMTRALDIFPRSETIFKQTNKQNPTQTVTDIRGGGFLFMEMAKEPKFEVEFWTEDHLSLQLVSVICFPSSAP
jgi:hypothetical protein